MAPAPIRTASRPASAWGSSAALPPISVNLLELVCYYHTVCFDKADSHYRAGRTLLTIQKPIIISMACRQRLCCGLLRSAGATSPFSVIRPMRSTLTWRSTYSPPQNSSFSTTPFQYAEIIVKVPPMAESISEGTLSSFTKQPGDYVEQDEEIASIETDKVMRQRTAYWSSS